MKRISIVILFVVVSAMFCYAEMSRAQAPDQAKKFEEYRGALKKAYGIDIKNFKDSMKGGRADGKEITKYDLKQLIMGIKVEQEHTTNKLRALEISIDHLEEFPDYYTRLNKMEEEAEKEMEQKKAKK
ncbi:MAG: hypothetical protein C0407_12790 [Desulfobacca sp.]|nr:hypothetical protein [Desulfobacca sp.]